jgi:hypothetical protein
MKFRGGAILVIDEYLWKPEAGIPEMEAWHKKFRRKDGRVTSAGSWDHNIGRWRPMGLMFVNQAKIVEYMKYVQRRVGSLKAGWLPAIDHYARLSRGSAGRFTGWIKGQAVKAGGATGNMDESGNGYLTAENTSHHAHAIRNDTVAYSAKHIEKIMKFSRNGINKRLQRLVDQFNDGKSATVQVGSMA